MNFKRILLLIFILVNMNAVAQNAGISGIVEDEKGQPIAKVSIAYLGQQPIGETNDSGYFSLKVRANKQIALVFTHVNFAEKQKIFLLNPNEDEKVRIILSSSKSTLQDVIITSKKGREEVNLITVNHKNAIINPAPISNIENLIKVFVNSRSELSSQYEVRGGNYDENLIYVNDFEIFKPYLVRSGQQEGLTFINPELTANVNFYNGGFAAKYGDKMSSVLDVEYKKPKANGGSAYLGLLEQGAHLEGISKNKKLSYLVGARNRSLRGLLGSQETKGNYVPSSSDFQAFITYKASPKWDLELLTNLSNTKFTLEPEFSQQTTSVFTSQFSSNLGLDIYFQGREVDKYSTRMAGLSSIHKINENFKLKGMLSFFQNKEEENINIQGSYLFGDREFDKSSAEFGQINNPLGAGVFLNYARNSLDVKVVNASLKGYLKKGLHNMQFGISAERNSIKDLLNEFEYQDSAGYSLPNQPGPLNVFKSVNGNADLDINRFSGYIQDNYVIETEKLKMIINAGVRLNYNDLNKEFLVSPRAGITIAPLKWSKDILFKIGTGVYNQPPFYREMRRYDGTINTDLKAQKSYQVSAGFDYAFIGFQKPMRLSVETYYKNITNLIPYDIDNVRLRYFGENMGKAYAYGIEGRLFGELVKDAESWLSIGYMNAKENLVGDYYLNYFNAAGELIGANTPDQVAVRNEQVDIGWLRRPTDRRINFGMFFSDYLTTNKNFKVFLQSLFGTSLPYNIPGSTRYRNGMEIPSYFRFDLGFNYQLLKANKVERRYHSPFKNLDNIWISLEVFNLLDKANTISYTLIKDFSNSTFAVPNRLTPRLINFKIVTRW